MRKVNTLRFLGGGDVVSERSDMGFLYFHFASSNGWRLPFAFRPIFAASAFYSLVLR